ncbi:MAG TPA: HEPN domain-containing protein [Eubacteriales bacterium]|nr:HEPN domain-containing protein [Eubacteriales bacterium]
MNKLDKCGYWLMLSDYDMGTIDALIQGERWVYVAFLCQQATERQLKAMYVYFMEAEPPKTHNVNFLFSKITDGAAFKNGVDFERFSKGRNECEDFLMDVMFYYMSDYPFSYKNITSRFVKKDLALELYEKTKKYVLWLRGFLPEIEVPGIPE